MKLRKFTSLGLFVTTLVVTITGVALLFHSSLKVYLKVGHEYFSYAFIAFMIMHTVYNIKPLKSYFISKKFNMPVSKEFVSSLVLAVALLALTVSVAGSKMNSPGDFSYPTIESIPLSIVLEKEGIDYTDALEALKSENYTLPEGVLTLGSLSKANSKSPKLIYDILSSVQNKTSG